jgi:hypothetical protein
LTAHVYGASGLLDTATASGSPDGGDFWGVSSSEEGITKVVFHDAGYGICTAAFSSQHLHHWNETHGEASSHSFKELKRLNIAGRASALPLFHAE